MIGDPRGPWEEPEDIASVRSQDADKRRQAERWSSSGDQECNLEGSAEIYIT